MELALESKIGLNNGVEIPVLGLGTSHACGEAAVRAVMCALEVGYRHIDTAKLYSNECEVGEGVKRSGIPRDEVFITTKLWDDDHGYDNALKAIDISLRNLGTNYVDLYLVHWPVPGRRIETWRAMEKILKDGKARAIGVGNFTIRHLEELLPRAEIVPAVNQVEFTPYIYQKRLQDYCEARGIRIEAWAPLTRGLKLGDPRLEEVAKHYEKTPAQVLIRWGLQKGAISIPKSERKERIVENSRVFDFSISDKDMRTLDDFNENLRTLKRDPNSLQ